MTDQNRTRTPNRSEYMQMEDGKAKTLAGRPVHGKSDEPIIEEESSNNKTSLGLPSVSTRDREEIEALIAKQRDQVARPEFISPEDSVLSGDSALEEDSDIIELTEEVPLEQNQGLDEVSIVHVVEGGYVMEEIPSKAQPQAKIIRRKPYSFKKKYREEISFLQEKLTSLGLSEIAEFLNYEFQDPKSLDSRLALLYILFANFSTTQHSQNLFAKITKDKKSKNNNSPFYVKEITGLDFNLIAQSQSSLAEVKQHIYEKLREVLAALYI